MRWWNSALGALKSVAFCREDGVRAAWKLILACALYAVWAWAAARFLSMGFGALFDAWGLNAQTLSQAPGWAQALAAHYGKLISLISSAGVLALSWALMRLLASGRFERLRAADFARAALVGAAWVALGAGLFLLADSMRPYERGLTLHADMLWMLAVYLLAALAEERFTRTLTMRVAALNARPCWAYIASCIVFLVVTGGYALGLLGAVNMLLFGLVCARLSATGRAGASVGLRFAWSERLPVRLPGRGHGRAAVHAALRRVGALAHRRLGRHRLRRVDHAPAAPVRRVAVRANVAKAQAGAFPRKRQYRRKNPSEAPVSFRGVRIVNILQRTRNFIGDPIVVKSIENVCPLALRRFSAWKPGLQVRSSPTSPPKSDMV